MDNLYPHLVFMVKNKKQLKTDTIKKRSIYVYLPTEEMADYWKDLADRSNTSISKFVIEHVTNSLDQEKDNSDIESRVQLIKDKKRLMEENKELFKRIKMLETLCERLEKEVKSFTSEPFLHEDFTGVRHYERDLIRVFQASVEIRKEDIYQKLNINPSDNKAVAAVQNQIENLESYGLLKDIGGKWRWKG